MDFALREYKVNKQTTVELYREKVGWKNEIEKEILDAFIPYSVPSTLTNFNLSV